MKDLTPTEVNITLEKIRKKYDEFIIKYNKSPNLRKSFEDRYIETLKTRKNLSVFLLAEIQAIEELFKKEEKKIQENKAKEKVKNDIKNNKTFADRIIEENRKKYEKYPRIELSTDVDEEIEYLIGACRLILNDYMPVFSILISYSSNTVLQHSIKDIYDKMINNFNYSGTVPIARNYIYVIESSKDSSRMMIEYQKLIQNIGFLLNDTLRLIKKCSDYYSNNKDGDISVQVVLKSKIDIKKIPNITIKEYFNKSVEVIESIISDFRLKDIKTVIR